MRPLLLAFFLVNFAWAFLPHLETPDVSDINVNCPEGGVWTIPDEWPTAGRSLPCESFDLFISLLAEGKTERAEALLSPE